MVCILQNRVAMVQYIVVPGGACDVLSVFRQFAGEISFVKITENDNVRVRVTLLCVCDLVSQQF